MKNKFPDIEKLRTAWKLVGQKHYQQKYRGSKPNEEFEYLYHLNCVLLETQNAIFNSNQIYDSNLAMLCAILHDTIEDTTTTFEEIEGLFGEKVANGVMALTKNEALPKVNQMQDSLDRILKQGPEIAIVKMADRIANLQPPPHHWNTDKIKKYYSEALMIHHQLKDSNEYLSERFLQKINEYEQFFY